MVDHLTAAVLTRAVSAAPVFTPKSLDCATYHGLTIAPCNVGKGNATSRVDNGVGYVKKNCLAGLDLPDLPALNPAAKPWLDTVANGRLHGETRQQPTALWPTERSSLRPLPLHPLDRATVSQVRASRQCRLPLDTNRSSVPVHDAEQALTLTTSPDRRWLSHGQPLMARHLRRYERFHDVEDPDHPKPLLAQRKKARDHQRFRRFLSLSPQAELSYRRLEERRLNPHHHVRKIVVLSEIYPPEAVARALEDTCVSEAFSADSIAHVVAQRARFTPEASALHLTRRADRLDVRLAQPALDMYHATLPSVSPALKEDTSQGYAPDAAGERSPLD